MLNNVPMYMVLNVKQSGDKSLFFFSLLEAESHLPGVAVVALLAHWLEVHLRRFFLYSHIMKVVPIVVNIYIYLIITS